MEFSVARTSRILPAQAYAFGNIMTTAARRMTDIRIILIYWLFATSAPTSIYPVPT